MGYKTIYTEVEVEVDLADFEIEDLIDELENRGSLPMEAGFNGKELVETIYQKRRLGQDYQQELDKLIYSVLGRIL
jgi:hypothetical protein